MVAVSRFTEFSVVAPTFIDNPASDGTADRAGRGYRGFSRGTGLSAGTDRFTINAGEDLTVNINGTAETITLASGTDLDPRFVARDITYKLHAANSTDEFNFAQCEWRNGGGGFGVDTNTANGFIIHSGVLGNDSGANDVNVTAGSAQTKLGFGSATNVVGGADSASSYTGDVTMSGGVYGGQTDDFYTIQISSNETVVDAIVGGSNLYGVSAGTITTGGLHAGAAQDLYTITISTSAGTLMNAGGGNVPTFGVTSSPGGDNSPSACELLYSDHWYDVGTQGVRVKFSDAPFQNGDTFDIHALTASGGGGTPGTAVYIFSSSQEDSSKAHSISPITTSATLGTQVGTRGANIELPSGGTLVAGDFLYAAARGPQLLTESITQLNFGNVTVSTQSAVKVVWFELIAGAIGMSTVKFSLQDEGTFAHHDTGNNDTEFHFGTVGAGNDAPGTGSTENNQWEFPVDTAGLGRVVAGDIDQDTPVPNYLFATTQDLPEVNSADLAEDIGNYQGGLVSDFVYLAIKLGASETGANSTINYRMYFDFTSMP